MEARLRHGQLTSSIEELFSEMIGYASPDDVTQPSRHVPAADQAANVIVCENRDGYAQTLDDGGLLEIATENDLVIQLHFRPGDFIHRDQVGFSVWPRESVDDELSQQLQDCIALGVARTPHQNLLFIVDQLVESASRALSPGVNDPYTAIICMRWLGNGLIVMATRQDPEPYRYDATRTSGSFAKAVTFRDVCSAIFDQLRPYYATDRNAAIQMMQTIATVRSCTRNEDRRAPERTR
ncbi:MAG: DUF2254 family protein [Planctomycetaceae bacterium]